MLFLKYVYEPFCGKKLVHPWKPYCTTTNNGFVIESQDENLLIQLSSNDNDPCGDIIDWHLFRVGETVLIDNYGVKYGCVNKYFNYKIVLDKILE